MMRLRATGFEKFVDDSTHTSKIHDLFFWTTATTYYTEKCEKIQNKISVPILLRRPSALGYKAVQWV
jgi:hypothetical protein